MGEAAQDLTQAYELPQGDVIRILLEQHAQIRTLCTEVAAANATAAKTAAFDELRRLLAVHEAAEGVVVRPRSRVTAGESVANDRDAEEKAAAQMLVQLADIPIDTGEFDATFDLFARAVVEHAGAEESQEFPRLLIHFDAEERQRLGTLFTEAEKLAPNHPHPQLTGSRAWQVVFGPVAALIDRAKATFASRDAMAPGGGE